MLTDLRFKYFTESDHVKWHAREVERMAIYQKIVNSTDSTDLTAHAREDQEKIIFLDRADSDHISQKYKGHTDDILKDIQIIIDDVTYEDFIKMHVNSFIVDRSVIKEFMPATATDFEIEEKAARVQSTIRKEHESYDGARIFLIGMVDYLLRALDDHDIGREAAYPILKRKAREWFPEEKYPLIRQGTATNILSKIIPIEQRNTTINRITGTAKVEAAAGNATLTIPDFVSRAGFRTSTHQLLDALVLELTKDGAKSPFVSIPLSEYMEKRGIKDAKEARKQVNSDLQELYDATFSFQEKRKNAAAKDYHDIRIIDSKGIKKGIINISFGSVFYEILKSYPLMPYPAQLWRLDNKKNPNSYYLLRRISEHRNMNDGKKNADTIAVKTLLAAAPFLPTYDEVQSSNRNFRSRIIDKFERDMDALSDTLTWHYCHRNNTPVSDQELSTMDYELFESLLVNVQWADYPDQTQRHERQRQRIEAAKEKQPKAAPKKKASSGTQSKSRARKKKPTDTQTSDKTKGTDKNKQ